MEKEKEEEEDKLGFKVGLSKSNTRACPAVYCCVLLLLLLLRHVFFTSTSTAHYSAICLGRMLIFSPK